MYLLKVKIQSDLCVILQEKFCRLALYDIPITFQVAIVISVSE